MNLFEQDRKDSPILGFFGKYRFLSNYHLCTCLVYDIPFKSSEHAYMYQKAIFPEDQQRIIYAETPKEAKKIGSDVTLRPDWNYYRKEAMLIALQAKFRNADLKKMLQDTGDSYLEETNTWGDTYWGVCGRAGQNNLGKLLMEIRKYP